MDAKAQQRNESGSPAGSPRLRRWWRVCRPWLIRYGPCEVLGTAFGLLFAWITLQGTGSLGAAAIAGSSGEGLGFYLIPAVRAFRLYRASLADRSRWRRSPLSALLTVRSLLIEFGPSEILDTFLLRPGLLYLGPVLLGNPLLGWLIGKLVSDIAFYAIAGFGLRRHRSLIEPSAGRRRIAGPETGVA